MRTEKASHITSNQQILLQKQSYRISTQNLRRVDDVLEIFLGAMAFRIRGESTLLGAMAGTLLSYVEVEVQNRTEEKIRAIRMRSICTSPVIGACMLMKDCCPGIVPFLAGAFGVNALKRRLSIFANGNI